MKCDRCGVELKSWKATKERPFEYRGCGFEGVYLVGVSVAECPRCAIQCPTIPRLPDLLRSIALFLAEKPAPLTGPELRFLRTWAGYSVTDFAALLHVKREHLSRFEGGRYDKLGGAADTLARVLALEAQKQRKHVHSVLHAKRADDAAPIKHTLVYRGSQWKAAA